MGHDHGGPEWDKEAFHRRMLELQAQHATATDFAAHLGVRLSTAQSWVRYAVPKIDAAVLIADRCGVSLDWLAGRSEAGGPAMRSDGGGAGLMRDSVERTRDAAAGIDSPSDARSRRAE